MDILLFLNVYNSYIKYIYYLLVIIIVVVLIMLFKKLACLANSSSKLLATNEKISKSLSQTEDKINKIEHTCTVSIPFFLNIFTLITVVNAITKDFFNTKNSKRSLKKSINKIYKIEKRVNPSFSFGKIINSLVK